MYIILKCQSCNKPIDENANTCLQCGNTGKDGQGAGREAKKKKERENLIKGAVVLIIIILLVIGSCSKDDAPVNNTQTTQQVQISDEQKAKIEAEQKAKVEAERLAKEPISTNFISFDNKYSNMTEIQQKEFWQTVDNKYVQWSGKIEDVTKDAIWINCGNSLTFDFVAHVKDNSILIQLNKGQTVTVKGQLDSPKGTLFPYSLVNVEIVSN